MHYYTLGRTGLKVSRLALGTMTFGDDWGWGADDNTSRRIFNTYVEAGGNFFDTADMYTNGRSEEMLGQFIRDAGIRNRAVIATKFTTQRRAIRTPAATGARTSCAPLRARSSGSPPTTSIFISSIPGTS